VDPESRRSFWDKLFELADGGTTLLVSTHYMEEAERCHRIAILNRGRLVGDGPPGELTEALAGRTIVVHATQPRRAQQALSVLPGVVSVAQIGNQLRVLCGAAGARRDELRAALQAAGLEGTVEQTSPNLEDVFVAATRGSGQGGEADR
jgi:ABC-2 type transport system ATP-binding protein